MKKNYIIHSAEKEVLKIFKERGKTELVFHNYKHTVDVVKRVNEICEGLKIEDESKVILTLAAWFHDTGYLEKKEGHEALSAITAEEFLQKEKWNPENIELVKKCIMATTQNYYPKTILEEIIKDADTLNVGTEGYKLRSDLLRLENSFIIGTTLNQREWLDQEVNFLKKHQFHTSYAQLEYNDGKALNLLKRIADLGKLEKKAEIENTKIIKGEGKESLPQRGVETMFRTTLRNHIALSAIADNKANLMLSINAIIISITISAIVPNLDRLAHLLVPTGFLLAVCLTSIVLATISTRPKIIGGTFTKEEVETKKANLLFFGNFAQTSLEYYTWGMNEMMKDKEFLYGAMIRDLHSLGVVLQKKYRFLSWTYLIFMYGMISAVVLFVITMLNY